MKKLAFLFCIGLLFAACENDSNSGAVDYKVNEPVFMSSELFRNSVNVTNDARELNGIGKICFYNGYLYISDSGKGIHIIDNTNPSNPQNVGYIELIGNYDITVRDDLLYADALIDLVWFDVSNPSNPVLKGRLENAFPEVLPPVENEYGYDYGLCYNSKENEIVVGWNVKRRVESIEDYYSQRIIGGNSNWGIWLENMANFDSSSGNKSGGSGITGSMSRFSLYDNYLYAVINNQMIILDLTDETPVKAVENLYIGGNVETIFSYEDKMFMGTPTGMMIYSVENPLAPEYCSMIWHVYGCDPVIVEDDLAYVTIHAGNFCGQDNNELFIVDVSNVYQPKQLVSYTMTSPKGLGIDKGTLFLCDDGLKAFKLTDPQTLMSNQLIHIKGMDGYDLIPYNNVLMMITDKGLYQYDYSNLNDIKQLSILSIK